MFIDIDHDLDAHGNILGVHQFDPDASGADAVSNYPGYKPGNTNADWLKWFMSNPKLHAQAGWLDVSNHKRYTGLTRLDVLKEEAIRLNHANARKALGV